MIVQSYLVQITNYAAIHVAFGVSAVQVGLEHGVFLWLCFLIFGPGSLSGCMMASREWVFLIRFLHGVLCFLFVSHVVYSFYLKPRLAGMRATSLENKFVDGLYEFVMTAIQAFLSWITPCFRNKRHLFLNYLQGVMALQTA